MLVFIGGPEIILIVLVIVLFFGSKKIPEFAKAFAKAMNEIITGIEVEHIRRKTRTSENCHCRMERV